MNNLLNNRKLQAFLAFGSIIIFIVAFVAYFIFIFSMIPQIRQAEIEGTPPVGFIAGIVVFILSIIIAGILSISSLIYYIIHALKNPNFKRTDNTMQIVWILIFFFVSGIGQMIYYFVEIMLRNPKPVIGDEMDEIENINGYQN